MTTIRRFLTAESRSSDEQGRKKVDVLPDAPENALLTASAMLNGMGKRIITFFVDGTPKPAGSKRGFYIAKLKRVVITDDNKNSRDWKTDVQQAAVKHRTGELLSGPLNVTFHFFVMRPKGHFGSGKNATTVKLSAPAYPASKPDCLKLARAVEDAMTGVLYRDDCQIVTEHISKRYHDRPGVEVRIEEL